MDKTWNIKLYIAVFDNDSSYQDLTWDCLSTSLTYIWFGYYLLFVIGSDFQTHPWTILARYRILLFCTTRNLITVLLLIAHQLNWSLFDMVIYGYNLFSIILLRSCPSLCQLHYVVWTFIPEWNQPDYTGYSQITIMGKGDIVSGNYLFIMISSENDISYKK